MRLEQVSASKIGYLKDVLLSRLAAIAGRQRQLTGTKSEASEHRKLRIPTARVYGKQDCIFATAQRDLSKTGEEFADKQQNWQFLEKFTDAYLTETTYRPFIDLM